MILQGMFGLLPYIPFLFDLYAYDLLVSFFAVRPHQNTKTSFVIKYPKEDAAEQ
ncbi:hypothetical protein ABIC55_004629 [Sporosarcina psychrophila]|uniref:Uncharacterized protein n=1 Tax=Sporosarcina psychrophila TaxID=1476 RepID=A0ABV2KEI7_SPOPS